MGNKGKNSISHEVRQKWENFFNTFLMNFDELQYYNRAKTFQRLHDKGMLHQDNREWLEKYKQEHPNAAL